MPFSTLVVPSPLGALTLFAEAGHIISLDWGKGASADEEPDSVLLAAKEQLAAYFDGRLFAFDLPLDPGGTVFQNKVWQAICRIPYGKTRSYGDVAAELKSSARAVGGACGANPIPLIIPCHRILAGHGKLGGYSGMGGIETKAALLALETRHRPAA